MKTYITTFVLLLGFSLTFGQNDYPEPERTSTRLFYIQHSIATNTYVYDANIKNGAFDSKKPIEQYRIMFEKKGEKKSLTDMQRKLAYGMSVKSVDNGVVVLNLAADKEFNFYLSDTSNPVIHVDINNKKMLLDRIFIKMKSSTKPEYVLFYGKDFNTKASITEKIMM